MRLTDCHNQVVVNATDVGGFIGIAGGRGEEDLPEPLGRTITLLDSESHNRDRAHFEETFSNLQALRALGATCEISFVLTPANFHQLAVLEKLAERLGCEVAQLAERGVIVDSAGTFAGSGGGASPHAAGAMVGRGIDISDHVSSGLSAEQIQQADYVFAMTRLHLNAILGLAPSAKDRVALVLVGEDVDDPIGSGEGDYEQCAQTIERGVRARMREVNL